MTYVMHARARTLRLHKFATIVARNRVVAPDPYVNCCISMPSVRPRSPSKATGSMCTRQHVPVTARIS